jgi:hypothetical protein
MSDSEHKDFYRVGARLLLIVLGLVLVASLVISLPLIIMGVFTFTSRAPGCPACEAIGSLYGVIMVGLGGLGLLVLIFSAGSMIVVWALRARWK